MEEEFVWIEPLKHKIDGLLKGGQDGVLTKAITLYGSETDLAGVGTALERASAETPDLLRIVDMVPLTSLGTHTRLSRLPQLFAHLPFALAVAQDIYMQQLEILRDLPVVIVDRLGVLVPENVPTW